MNVKLSPFVRVSWILEKSMVEDNISSQDSSTSQSEYTIMIALVSIVKVNYMHFKAALVTILTKKIMFWKLVNSFKMMK